MIRIFLLSSFVYLMTSVSVLAADQKEVRFNFKNASPVIFNHSFHLPLVNKDCKACHSKLFDLKSKTRVGMAAMESGRSCGACHNGTKAFSVSSEKNCSRCHRGVPKSITYKTSAGEAFFSHDSHVYGKNFGCKSCHNRIQKRATMADMEKGRGCGMCHDGKKAFASNANCGTCHRGLKTKDITFKVKGATEAVFSHQKHLAIYKCADCHTKIFPYKAGKLKATMADMDSGKSCGACHNKGKDAFTLDDCGKCHKM